ncbi:hypothetical protein ACJQWK_05525 [Exserohilum turcicum]
MTPHSRYTGQASDGFASNRDRTSGRRSPNRAGQASGRAQANTASSSREHQHDEYSPAYDPVYREVARPPRDDYRRLQRVINNPALEPMHLRSAHREPYPDSRYYPHGHGGGHAHAHANGGNVLGYPSASIHAPPAPAPAPQASQLQQPPESVQTERSRYPAPHANTASRQVHEHDYSPPYHGIWGVRRDGRVYDYDDTFQEYRARGHDEREGASDDNESDGYYRVRSHASHY